MAAPPAANAPPDMSTCEPLDWETDNSKDLEWAWDRFSSRAKGAEPWTHQQRVLLQNPALYYSNQSVREKGEMQEAQQWKHAAECMRTTAAPGAILFFRDVCNFRIPKGLDAAQLGKTSSTDDCSLFDGTLKKCYTRGQEQRRELKIYTQHYNTATNEHGQPKSGQQNGDLMVEVIALIWEEKNRDSAHKAIKQATKKRNEALARRAKTKDKNDAAKIKIPVVPDLSKLLAKEQPDGWLPPCWLTWLLYGPLSPCPDEDVSFRESNGPAGAGECEDEGANADGDEGDSDDEGYDNGQPGGDASTSGSGGGNSSSTSPSSDSRAKGAGPIVGKGKGKKRSIGVKGSAGKVSVKSKRSYKCLTGANEGASRRAMQQKEREERRRAQGEEQKTLKQLRLAEEGHSVLVSAMRQVQELSGNIAQSSYAERRKVRIDELRTLEQMLREDDRTAEADQVKNEKYHLLFNPNAPLGGGGAAGAVGGAGMALSGGGGVGMALGGGGGAGVPTAGNTGAGVSLGGGGAAGSPGGGGTPIAGKTGAGVGAGVMHGGESAAGSVGGKISAGDMISSEGGLSDADDLEEDDEDMLGGDSDGGGGSVSAFEGVGGGVGGGGQGGGSGNGHAPQTPRCEKHGVECAVYVTASGTKTWTCGLPSLIDQCDHFGLVDDDPSPPVPAAANDEDVICVNGSGGRADKRNEGASAGASASNTAGAFATAAIDVDGAVSGGVAGGQGALAGAGVAPAAGVSSTAAQAAGGVVPVRGAAGGVGGGQGASPGFSVAPAAGVSSTAAQAAGGVVSVGSAAGGVAGGQGASPGFSVAPAAGFSSAAAQAAGGVVAVGGAAGGVAGGQGALPGFSVAPAAGFSSAAAQAAGGVVSVGGAAGGVAGGQGALPGFSVAPAASVSSTAAQAAGGLVSVGGAAGGVAGGQGALAGACVAPAVTTTAADTAAAQRALGSHHAGRVTGAAAAYMAAQRAALSGGLQRS